ncbi:MAG: YcxB family protein [Clostridiales bacterium]|nr:YcxB family protein [Clostridiales bacterium]
MQRFTASILYDEDHMRKLSACISATFQMGLKAIYLVICVGLLVAGATIGLDSPAGIVCIGFGCFLLPSVNVGEKSRCDREIRRMNGKWIRVNYQFNSENFVGIHESERNEFTYESIIRLVDSEGFFYLFPNPGQAYMIDKSTLNPQREEDFKKFIQKQVGLEWTRPASLFSLNIRQMKFNRMNTRK